MIKVVKKTILRSISLLFDILPPKWLIKSLLKLDNVLYYLHQQAALRYGNGKHPKHRLTNYHKFFTSRIKYEQTVLDIGCSIGALARSIAETGAKVTGIEINKESYTRAKILNPHPNITYLHGDVCEEKFTETFEVVVMSNVLEHLDKRVEFLKRVIETVQPDFFLIRVPLFERDWRVPLKKELGIDYRLDPTHYTEYTQESFFEEMEHAGLEIQYIEYRWGEIWSELTPLAVNEK